MSASWRPLGLCLLPSKASRTQLLWEALFSPALLHLGSDPGLMLKQLGPSHHSHCLWLFSSPSTNTDLQDALGQVTVH